MDPKRLFTSRRPSDAAALSRDGSMPLKKLSLRGRQLLLIDLLAICISFVLSFALRFDALLLTALAGAWRFALRISGIGRKGANLQSETGLRTLIVAEASAASGAIRQVTAGRSPNLRPIGLLADDLSVGQSFHGISVL